MEPLSFSVAALLGEKLSNKSSKPGRKEEEDTIRGSTHSVLLPTPQPSDSEEDEPPRKRRCIEQCELARVNKIDSLIDRQLLYFLSSSFRLHFPSISLLELIDWNENIYGFVTIRFCLSAHRRSLYFFIV